MSVGEGISESDLAEIYAKRVTRSYWGDAHQRRLDEQHISLESAVCLRGRTNSEVGR